jgi:hypothetical protein
MKADVRVECHSGYKGDKRPVRFHLRERAYEVLEVVDQWYGPEATYFRVAADDGNVYVLRHGRGEEGWTLEAFRRA